jgi:dsDNA-binding SOS-regulon protein
MDRRFHLLVIIGALGIASPASAQTPPQKETAPEASATPDSKKERRGSRKDDLEHGRRKFELLTPEQREKLKENISRWKKLPAEERKHLRDYEGHRKERMAKEIETAIQESGLQLSEDQREVFALRYAQERRKIEMQLRKEMEEKRKPMLQDLNQRLKNEFASQSPPPAASPAPAP